MAGHSKWNNIKQKKGAEDAKKGRVFTQMAKNIRIAVKSGGGDVSANPNLRMWMDKARAVNMPKDKIQKAIDSGLGKGTGGQVQEINYECFGPNGVAIIIMAATNNTNRTSSEIKALLTRAGGGMGGPGSVSYMFDFNRETQEFTCTMPMLEVDEELRENMSKLIDSLYEIDDIEGIFTSISDESGGEAE